MLRQVCHEVGRWACQPIEILSCCLSFKLEVLGLVFELLCEDAEYGGVDILGKEIGCIELFDFFVRHFCLDEADLMLDSVPLDIGLLVMNKVSHVVEQIFGLVVHVAEAFLLTGDQARLVVIEHGFSIDTLHELLSHVLKDAALELRWAVLAALHAKAEALDSTSVGTVGRHIVAELLLGAQLVE